MGNRNKSIEIHISDISQIPESVLKDENGNDIYDIQESSKEQCHILWIHPDGYKPFDRKLLPYMQYVSKVVNREALQLDLEHTDYLNLYIEAQEINKMGIDTGTTKYKNIRWAEIIAGQIDISKVLLRKEVLNTIL